MTRAGLRDSISLKIYQNLLGSSSDLDFRITQFGSKVSTQNPTRTQPGPSVKAPVKPNIDPIRPNSYIKIRIK